MTSDPNAAEFHPPQVRLHWRGVLLHRRVLLAASVLLVIGSTAVTGGYTWYLHSHAYRRKVKSKVEAFFDLPASIGRTIPLSFSSRGFRDLVLWLPDRKAVVYRGAQAVWHDEPTAEQPLGWRLELYDGQLTLDEALSRQAVTERVRGGLAGIDELQLHTVDVFGVDLTYRRRGLELSARSASGRITFPSESQGKASLVAHVINETRVTEPIHIFADFDPRGGVIMHELILQCARVPIAALALNDVLGSAVGHGEFSGKVIYQEQPEHWQVTLAGSAEDVQLAELTAALPRGPVRGMVTLRLEEARLIEQALARLQVTGQVRNVPLGDLTRVLRLPRLSGSADLRVQECLLQNGRVVYFSATGQVRDIPCEQLSRLLGEGEISGWLDVGINRIYVEDNELRAADIDLVARPPADGAGTIDRELLLGAIQRIFGVELPPILPARIEYAALGAKLLVEHDRLRILGSHGADGRTVLTVRVRGLEIPVIRQPKASFDLRPTLEALRRRAQQYDLRELLQPPVTGTPPTEDAKPR